MIIKTCGNVTLNVLHASRKVVDVEFKVSSEGFGEELSPGLMAMREALVNLLMHADYFSPAYSRIRIFNNRIEFFNPGGLPKPIEELKEKDLSMPRNPIISKLFRMVRLAENAGFGFDKIDSNWKKYNDTEPIYDISFDSTIIKLITQVVEESNETMSEELSEECRKNFGRMTEELQSNFGDGVQSTYLLIAKNPEITAVELAIKLNVSERTIRRNIKKLFDNKLIIRIGSKKKGSWELNDIL